MTTPLMIELKSIKFHPGLSRGTNAYEAKLIVDGRHICDVSNDGNGGCDRMAGPGKGIEYGEALRLYEAACVRVRSEYPKQDLSDMMPGDAPVMVEDSMDFLCARIVERHELLKPVLRAMKTKVAYYEKGRPSASGTPLYTMTTGGAAMTAAIASVRARYPSAWILNEQSEDDIVDAVRKAQ